MRPPRLILITASVLGAGLALAACGGEGGSSASTPASTPSTTSTTSTNAATGSAHRNQQPAGTPAGRRSQKEAEPARPQPSPREVRKAGNAAGFLVGGGDNSVPTYGSEASSSQRSSAEVALSAFLSARAREDWPSACGYLAAATRSRLEEFAKGSQSKAKGCGPILKMFSTSGPGPSLASPLTHPLSSLRIEGESAFALWVGPHGQKYAMPMAREGDSWRVTQVAPLPYPPGSGV